MTIRKIFDDGISSLNNSLANRRTASTSNRIASNHVDWSELRAIYRTGIGSKIIRIKTGVALNDTMQFDNADDEAFYKTVLQKHVKKAAKFQLAFGRALIVIHEPGADLSQPLPQLTDWARVQYRVFSGDMIAVQSVNLNLNSPDYLQPERFSIRGFTVHPSRVVDFKYVEPVEHDASEYNYGGISEFELIRNELVADGVIQRAVPAMLEKSSTLFYKIKGFKDLLADKREGELIKYFESLENLRSIYGAGIIDQEDLIEVHAQALSNLGDSDLITLRRLAMVTGIPLSWLVGEAATGLNSTGSGERNVFKHTIEAYQSDYLLENINRFMGLHGRGQVEFKDGLLETDVDKMRMETDAIANALILWQMGEDANAYLVDHAVIKKDNWEDFWQDDKVTEPEQPAL
ncbi:MAG: DUF1073 domain-containing protein [Methyloprofundus sp.]|nr:DUF1073 domain-containing protein [Methyloprofundus sp.]